MQGQLWCTVHACFAVATMIDVTVYWEEASFIQVLLYVTDQPVCCCYGESTGKAGEVGEAAEAENSGAETDVGISFIS